MSDHIDGPSDAQFYAPVVGNYYAGFYKFEDGKWYFMRLGSSSWTWPTLGPSKIRTGLISRPQTNPTDGLPNIGDECMMADANGVFIPVTIFAKRRGYAFGWSEERNNCYLSKDPAEFRPALNRDLAKAIVAKNIVAAHGKGQLVDGWAASIVADLEAEFDLVRVKQQ